jgi:hypothetical protein
MNVHRRIAHGLKGLDTDFFKNHSVCFLCLPYPAKLHLFTQSYLISLVFAQCFLQKFE